MSWKIDSPKSFERKAAKLLKKNPQLNDRFKRTIKQLIEDPFSPVLKTHTLSGDLKNKYACCLTDDLRIIFKLSADTMHLLDIGSHDEVY